MGRRESNVTLQMREKKVYQSAQTLRMNQLLHLLQCQDQAESSAQKSLWMMWDQELMRRLQKLQTRSLKKQPEIVETARCLRKYVGPSDQSGYSAAERSEIARGVKQVRERANTLLTRLQSIFPNYSTTTGDFSEFFQEEVSLFHEATKGWAEEKVLSTTIDPMAIEA